MRRLAFFSLVIALAGCGGESDALSVSKVKATFSRHGIELAPAPRLIDGEPKQLVGFEPNVNVTIYSTVSRASEAPRTVFVLGGGRPHRRRVRNVIVSWAGPAGADLNAAIDELR
jgi:hypothetical protein